MTGKVARALGRVDPMKLPRVCPKCGRMMQEPYGESLARHLRVNHPDSIGIAVPKDDPARAREFSYLAPVAGMANTWHVVWLDWPFEAARLNRAIVIVQWQAGAGPAGKE